ncbi:MAG: hypothetical protein R6U61_08465 [Thermoplasmata archaeon]
MTDTKIGDHVLFAKAFLAFLNSREDPIKTSSPLIAVSNAFLQSIPDPSDGEDFQSTGMLACK